MTTGADGEPSSGDGRSEPDGGGQLDDARARLLIEHAWRYFQLHATQRIAVFNFFVVASGLTFAGLATVLQAQDGRALLGVPVGALMMLMAFVFWKLDQRGAFLVKHAEAAMAEAEKVALPPEGRLFATESNRGVAKRHWSFGRSFRVFFAVVALAGLTGIVVSAAKAPWLPLRGGSTPRPR